MCRSNELLRVPCSIYLNNNTNDKTQLAGGPQIVLNLEASAASFPVPVSRLGITLPPFRCSTVPLNLGHFLS